MSRDEIECEVLPLHFMPLETALLLVFVPSPVQLSIVCPLGFDVV